MNSSGLSSKNEFSGLIGEKWEEEEESPNRHPTKKSIATVDDCFKERHPSNSSPAIERINNQLNHFTDAQPGKNVNFYRELSLRSTLKDTKENYSGGRQEMERSVDEEKPRFRRSRKRVLIRGLCCLGWILCCPCWACGLCLREDTWTDDESELEREMEDDPCWPCFYRTTSIEPEKTSIDDDHSVTWNC